MMLEYQHLIVSKVVVARSYHFFSRFQSFKHLIVLRILTAYADFTLYCLSSLRRHDIDPFSSGLLVECASWYQDGFLRLAQLQIKIICLTGADVCRLLSIETEICFESPLTYLGVYLSDDCSESLVLSLKFCFQSSRNSVNIVLINLCLNLLAVKDINLAYLHAAGN